MPRRPINEHNQYTVTSIRKEITKLINAGDIASVGEMCKVLSGIIRNGDDSKGHRIKAVNLMSQILDLKSTPLMDSIDEADQKDQVINIRIVK